MDANVISVAPVPVSVEASSASNNPRDREALLTLLPKEVWTLLLEEYFRHRSKDLLSCSRTCTLFDDILKEDKCNWLFELIFPHVFPYLSGGEVLNCRKISRVWRRAVDLFLENFETRVPFQDGLTDLSATQRYNPLASRKIGAVKMETKSKIKRFMEEMSTDKNPFIGRSIWIADEEKAIFSNRYREGEGDLNTQDFWEMSIDMLTLYGEHIAHFTTGNAFGLGTGLGTKRFHQVLKLSLEKMPQLKSLHLYGLCNEYDDYNGHGEVPEVDVRSHLFRQFLERNPLPEMNNLEMLELTYTFGFPPALMEKLIMMNPAGLKRLEIDVSEIARSDDPLTLPSMEILTQLTDLNIKVASSEQLREFLEYVSRDAKLGRLFVNFDCDNQSIDYDALCRAISPFTDSLRMFGLMSHDPVDEDDDDEDDQFSKDYMPRRMCSISLQDLVAPKLTSLEMDGVEFQPDYLSPETAASLEYLHVRRFFRRDTSSSQSQGNHHKEKRIKREKDFYAYVFDNELHSSDIWKKMKKLKVIKAESCSRQSHVNRFCTREMYEFHKKSKNQIN